MADRFKVHSIQIHYKSEDGPLDSIGLLPSPSVTVSGTLTPEGQRILEDYAREYQRIERLRQIARNN